MRAAAVASSSTALARRSLSASLPRRGDRIVSTSVLSRITVLISTRCVFLVRLHSPTHSIDIKVKEPDFKELMKGRTVYLPPRFMTCNQAIDELLEVEEKHKKGGEDPCWTLMDSVWTGRVGGGFGACWTAGSVYLLRNAEGASRGGFRQAAA